MPEDASLDQFASSEATETDSEDAKTKDVDTEDLDSEDAKTDGVAPEESEVQTEDAGPEKSEADTEDADASPVEPAVSTYQWSSEGGECADCGASAERLWRGEGQKDGGLVCPDCKDW